jgi:hypothetical protein
LADFPFLGKVVIYYIILFFGYYFLFYRYFNNTLDQQLLGLKDTLLLTFALILYLLLVLIPVYLWGRMNCNHPIWSGVEMFLCYASIFLVLGGIAAIFDAGDWAVLSGISAGASTWIRIISVLVFFAIFILVAWWGSRSAVSRRCEMKKVRVEKEKEQELQVFLDAD